MSVQSAPIQTPILHTHIAPTKGWVSLRLGELWRHRELLYFLTWRDFKVRYKQTVLGMSWAVLQPLLTMVVFTALFGRLAQISSDGLPYPIFNFAALVPWTFFAYALSQASNSLVSSSDILKKVYFPRLAMPLATVLSGLVDLGLAFVVLLAMMVYYGIVPTVNVVWLPLFLILAIMAAVGVSLWLSAMNVLFRDVRYVIPFLSQLWFFITPIAYSSTMLDEPWRTLYGLNPMAGVVEGFRWSLLGAPASPGLIIASCISATLLLITGAFYFSRMEKNFADVV
ncbi:MAG: ABC transporter permease [Caldilineaceae bacterium]|nr:ABC transporter permease [Caldilineaceae bacterium]